MTIGKRIDTQTGVIELKDSYDEQLVVLLESAMKYNCVSYPQVAEALASDGKKPARQSIFKKVKSGTLKATALFQILDFLGIDFKIEKDGKEIPVRLPVGERVRKTVKGKMYDTKRCLPVADSFYADGENKYRPENGRAEELYYEPSEDTYLLVHYSDGRQMKRRFPWIEILTPDEAETVKFSYQMH